MSDWTGPTCLMCDGTGEDFAYSGEPMEATRRDMPTGRPCRACNGHGRDATPCDACPFAGCDRCEYAGGTTVSVTYGTAHGTMELPLNEAAPMSASNTPEGLTTDCQGVEMAKANDTHTPSTAEPPAPLEGCPSCLARNNHPIATERPDARTVVGHYLCVTCGETWECSWWTGVPANV